MTPIMKLRVLMSCAVEMRNAIRQGGVVPSWLVCSQMSACTYTTKEIFLELSLNNFNENSILND